MREGICHMVLDMHINLLYTSECRFRNWGFLYIFYSFQFHGAFMQFSRMFRPFQARGWCKEATKIIRDLFCFKLDKYPLPCLFNHGKYTSSLRESVGNPHSPRSCRRKRHWNSLAFWPAHGVSRCLPGASQNSETVFSLSVSSAWMMGEVGIYFGGTGHVGWMMYYYNCFLQLKTNHT